MIAVPSMNEHLIIRGAKEHNLQSIDCMIPRNQFVVISGLSGSGKSTLAFDIVFSEGQRRYVECLSPYARQFLRIRSRPDVEHIEGVPPTVAIEQHTSVGGRKSTIATLSGVGDFLRLLFSRVSIPRCPNCQILADESGPAALRRWIQDHPPSADARLLAPIIRGRRGHHRPAIDRLAKRGVQELRVDGRFYDIDKVPSLKRFAIHDIDAVWPRRDDSSLIEALDLSGGTLHVLESNGSEWSLSQDHICPECGLTFPRPDPRVFSFNSKTGACEQCDGFGEQTELDEDNLNEHRQRSIRMTVRKTLPSKAFDRDAKKDIVTQLETLGLRPLLKVSQCTPSQKGILSRTLGHHLRRALNTEIGDRTRQWILKSLVDRTCQKCRGSRLREESERFEVQGKTISQIQSMTITEARDVIRAIKPEGERARVARPILKELQEQLHFLDAVGVGYLPLNRVGSTLSGGESQRVRLAGLARSGMRGALFVLDEPSIGLHARDNRQLIDVFRNLVASGNGVLVVEHDEETIEAADLIIDMGPGGGKEGGQIVAQGRLDQLKDSPTAQALRAPLPQPRTGEPVSDSGLQIRGAKLNNLKEVDVTIPSPSFTVVTGISGSGKSSLVMGCLQHAVHQSLLGETLSRSRLRGFKGAEHIDRLAVVDHSPIGRTPRSTPATYVKIWDEIRKLFALTEEARARGFEANRFSFNAGPGRCGQCDGQGQLKIEMSFLPDAYQTCPECEGRRYNEETLEIRYGGMTIADVLNMSIYEAVEFFRNHRKIHGKLLTMEKIGLGYLTLGQPSPTLSGGEAQRVKLASELGTKSRQRALFLLDEPSTGLHRTDVFRLIEVLQSLAEEGHTVVVIEHHLDVINAADYIIDLGPEGGDRGGEIVASGPPEELVKRRKRSATGECLFKHQKSHQAS